MKKLLGSILIFILISCLFSCEEDDDFSSDSGLRISFSTDTLRFDTVFTSFGSATRRMKVYNRNKNSLTIQSVELASGGTSGFRMNVDGVSGNRITDVDILKKDSIFIFVEVTVDPLNSNSPMQVRDSIRFNLNGKEQYVQLEAIGQDVIWLKNGLRITQDTTIVAEKPFLVYDSIVVDTNKVLNIEKNVRFYFHKGAGMKVYGTLNVKGTLEEPVVFRGDRTDNLFTTLPYDRIPGQWEGVVIDSVSYNNNFEFFHLRSSTKGVWFNSSNPSIKKATFMNSIIQNTSEHGIYAINSNIDFNNSLFTNAGGVVMKLIGGEYSVLHCTIANYMMWLRKQSALTIGNVLDDGENYVPIYKCELRNSIIAGQGGSAVSYQNKIYSAEREIDYYFENCLLNVNGSDDKKFVNIVWGEEPEFKNTNQNWDYFYDFDLDSASPAINKANPDFSLSLPYDIRGVSRMDDGEPDIGCYEWKKSTESE